MTRRRPDRDVALRLLSARGQAVTLRNSHLVEDVDGGPLGVEVEETTGVLCVTPELLGWTWEELGVLDDDDDEDDE